jgi:hypothetical protein
MAVAMHQLFDALVRMQGRGIQPPSFRMIPRCEKIVRNLLCPSGVRKVLSHNLIYLLLFPSLAEIVASVDATRHIHDEYIS